MSIRSAPLWAVAMLSGVAAAQPAVCRVTRADPGEAMLVFGTGFVAGQTEVLVWQPPNDEAEILAAARNLPTAPSPPRDVPAEAKPCAILQMDEQVIAAVNAGGQVLCVRTAAGVSPPFRLNVAELSWCERDQVEPGAEFRIFGKQLYSNVYQPKTYVVLVSAGGQVVRPQVAGDRHPGYILKVRLPDDLAPGAYRLFAHNNSGGVYGWSNPLDIEVVAPTPWPSRVFSVADLGAKGDGLTDDTAALQAALKQAADNGGGVVFVPPGTYIVSQSLVLPQRVWLKGAAQGATTLTVSPEHGFRGANPRAGERSGLLVLDTRCGVSDLTIIGRRPLYQMVWIRHEPYTEPGEDIFIRRCAFRNGWAFWEEGQWHSGELPVSIDGTVERLEVSDCSFISQGGLSGWGGVHKGRFTGNYFRADPPWSADMLSIRHLRECVVENNVIEFAHRGLCFQNWRNWGLFRRNLIAGNVVREVAARRDNASETLLLEGGSSAWRGQAASATETTLVGRDVSWEPDELAGKIALIVGGKGLGQYRTVAANTEDTLTLAEPWLVIPDDSTSVVVGEFFLENLLLDNSDLDSDAAVQYWGACLANVLEGHISRNAQGIWLWTLEDKDNFLTAYFNEIINCRCLDRGAIWFTADRTPGDAGLLPGAGLVVGNVVRISQISDFREKPGNQYWPYWLNPDYAPADYAAVALRASGPRPADGATPRSISYNLFEGNQLLRGPVGVRLTKGTYANVFRRNRVDLVGKPAADEGEANLFAEPLGQAP